MSEIDMFTISGTSDTTQNHLQSPSKYFSFYHFVIMINLGHMIHPIILKYWHCGYLQFQRTGEY